MTDHKQGRGSWSGVPDQDPRDHEHIALHGTARERWWLAGRSDLTPEIVDLLTSSGDEPILTALAMNYALSSEQLEDVSKQVPSLASLVRANRNAHPDTKDLAPLGIHTQDSILKYLDDRQATKSQREALVALYEDNGHPGDPSLTLGIAWRAVAGDQPRPRVD